jgi:hypothetical protein
LGQGRGRKCEEWGVKSEVATELREGRGIGVYMLPGVVRKSVEREESVRSEE